MTVCDDCFREFLHPVVHELMDKNERFFERYGQHSRWDWDDEAITLTFSDQVLPTLRIDVTLVGSTEGDSWEWSWANSNYETRSKLGMEKVRDFGQTNGFDKLTSAFLDADEFTGWEMTAVAAHILDALGAYRFPTEQGYCYLLYRKIEEIGMAVRA
ncbi:MAG: DUF6882 domain-containing protein [Terracidiphilus sp.]|jgi:hypothetical protein